MIVNVLCVRVYYRLEELLAGCDDRRRRRSCFVVLTRICRGSRARKERKKGKQELNLV